MIPARLVLVSLLVLAGGSAFAQQSTTKPAASCVDPPCASNLVWPGLGDLCRHMSAEERRKHPLTCGTAEPDARAGGAPLPAKSP